GQLVLTTLGGRRSDATLFALKAIDDRTQAAQIDEIVICLAVEGCDRILECLHLERHSDILQTFVREVQPCSVHLRDPGHPDPPTGPRRSSHEKYRRSRTWRVRW